MKHYIAYFDYLGFKEFINNNPFEQLELRAKQMFVTLENSLTDTTIQKPNGIYSFDINDISVNCINISDTIIFWSKDDSYESFNEIFDVAFRFNHLNNLYEFPVRGCIIFDDFNFLFGNLDNKSGFIYNANLMFGKGLLKAHSKTEQMNWAGTVIDDSVIKMIKNDNRSYNRLLNFSKEYPVPYKDGIKDEFVMLFHQRSTINRKTYDLLVESIINVFHKDNKRVTKKTKKKINNTIDFIKSCLH